MRTADKDNKIDGDGSNAEWPSDLTKYTSRIMYIEDKGSGMQGSASIGRIYFSRTRKTLYYRNKCLRSLKGLGFKSNYYDVNTGDEYWISGVKQDRHDRLYGGQLGVVIDDDVKDEYQRMIKA